MRPDAASCLTVRRGLLGLVVFAGAFACAAPVRAEGIPARLTYVERSDQSGRLLAVVDDGAAVRFQPEDGKTRRLPLEDLVEIAFGTGDDSSAQDTVTVLRGGDRLSGRITGGDEESVRISCRSLGTFKVKLDSLQGMVFPAAPAPLRARLLASLASGRGAAEDRLVLPNGDVLEGVIKLVSAKGVTLESATGARTLAHAELAAFALGQPAAAADAKTVTVRLSAADGSLLTGSLTRVGDGVLEFRTAIGRTVRVSPRAVRAITFRGGRLTYVSDLKPARVRQSSLLEGEPTVWRLQRDRNVLGGPLRLNGRTYRKGLGMHTRCEVRYALDGSYHRLLGLIGVDEGTIDPERPGGSSGNVIFRVRVDGKTVFDSGPVRRGEKPRLLNVPVRGAKELVIEADFGTNADDRGDHADWADLRLIR